MPNRKSQGDNLIEPRSQLAEPSTENPRVGGSIPLAARPSSRETLDASVLGFEAYADFKRNLGPRWAYYLFPVLRRDNWEEARSSVLLIARLLREGLWSFASKISGYVESGAAPTRRLMVVPSAREKSISRCGRTPSFLNVRAGTRL